MEKLLCLFYPKDLVDDLQDLKVPGRGPYCFKIHGQTYHSTGTLYPPEGRDRQYGQLYIIEGDQAVTTRMNAAPNSHCLRTVMETINIVMQEHSPYASAYKHMHMIEQEEQEKAAELNTEPPVVRLFFKRGPDCRRYNEPIHNEVAAIFVGEEGAPPVQRDIVVYPRDREPENISYMSCHIDPVCYPLLFPRGDLGWHYGMQHYQECRTATRTRLTMQQFYGYRLALRSSFSPVHSSGKLFQQYLVDAYVKTEGCRLFYIRNNQRQLRVDLYSGLMDHLHNQGVSDVQPGVPVILPSSFGGSPRAMQQNYQDAMAIVAKYGKPDLFLTYTCNPKAQEITENLRDHERSEHRPDLVSRVYHLHLAQLLRDIKDRHVLGVPVAHVHVIEFQKRGLPHCHMLIILRAEDKLRTREDIDRVISAEIPDPEEDPELYDVVKSCMIHGPCGAQNPTCACMEDGVCKKIFPKPFREYTAENLNGYPAYRRRNNGRTVQVGGLVADNSYVVPYNRDLLLKYRAHINVEACASVKSVKYLFKYVYKGHDCANMEMAMEDNEARDEVKTYLNCRYVSAPEAMWRLSEYRMHEQSHSIIRLAIHLPDQQRVFFRAGEETEAVNRENSRKTHLTAWFKLNESDQTAREYLYNEIPFHYVFKVKEKKWAPRKRGGSRIISRIYSVNPTNADKFHLRLLLLHVPGARSFDDLKTVEGIVCATFREACIQRHLLADDSEFNGAITEASIFQMPRQLRSMFATICVYCQPSDPLTLWTTHVEALIEDYIRTLHHYEGAVNAALHDVDRLLRENGTSCTLIGLPTPHGEPSNDPSPREPEPSFDELTDEQRRLVESVLRSVEGEDDNTSRLHYVDAPGGSGKTYVFNKIASYFRYHKKSVVCAAWTGIATTLMKSGRTVHNLFKLPVPVVDNSTCNISPVSKQAGLLRNVDLFVVDEASMIPSHALHAINRCLQDIMQDSRPFGGKTMLFGGDFRQVLPVIPRAPPAVVIDTCLKRSPMWPLFAQHRLTLNMRALPGEGEFSDWLLQLGNGTLNNTTVHPETVEIPPACICERDLVDEIFSATDQDHHNRVILSPKNEHCLQINERVLRILPGETKLYLSADSVKCDDEEARQNYPVEFLNSLTPSGMPPHRLNLKVNAVVMLLRNLSLRQGLCNGTRLKVTHMHNNCIQASILTGANQGNKVLIPRIKLAPSDTNLPFILERHQFPLRLAYSITINKAQGQTFEKVGIYLPSPVFSHGQLYVAFSRAKCMAGVKVDVGGNNTVTPNVIYREVLDST